MSNEEGTREYNNQYQFMVEKKWFGNGELEKGRECGIVRWGRKEGEWKKRVFS